MRIVIVFGCALLCAAAFAQDSTPTTTVDERPFISAPPRTTPTTIPKAVLIYKGKPRTQAWVDQQYAKFNAQIVACGKKYVDIGRARLSEIPKMIPTPPADGQELRYVVSYEKWGMSVEDVLPKDQGVIAYQPPRAGTPDRFVGSIDSRFGGAGIEKGVTGEPAIRIHISQLPTDRLVVGSMLTQFCADQWDARGMPIPNRAAVPLVYVGISRDLGTGAICHYVPYKPVTRRQFAIALKAGFKLVEYRRVGNQVVGYPVE